jgi:hypothetical protein
MDFCRANADPPRLSLLLGQASINRTHYYMP